MSIDLSFHLTYNSSHHHEEDGPVTFKSHLELAPSSVLLVGLDPIWFERKALRSWEIKKEANTLAQATSLNMESHKVCILYLCW